MLELEVKDMTKWCVQNRDKWDDYTKEGKTVMSELDLTMLS